MPSLVMMGRAVSPPPLGDALSLADSLAEADALPDALSLADALADTDALSDALSDADCE